MVQALGIDVRRTFTLVFALGGAAAGAGRGARLALPGSVSPGQGGSLLIFAFIVVVIGGSARWPAPPWPRWSSDWSSSSRTTTC